MSATTRHAAFVLRGNPVTALAATGLTLVVLAAIFAPWLVPYDPIASDVPQALHPPSAAHWMGTDQLGRDIFSRILVAARLDLSIAASAVVLSFVVGAVLGGFCGYRGGRLDRWVGRIVDVLMAFPLFVLAMALVAALGNRVENIVIATAVINLPFYTRFARAEVNVRRNAGWVEAARACGEGHLTVVLRFLLPNVLPAMAVQISLNLGWAILNAAGLSFIGLGVSAPTPEWGIMVAEGAQFITTGKWWLVGFPGLALMLTVLCFNLLGDGLRDILDPPDADMTLLQVEDLRVSFSTRNGVVDALRGISFGLDASETLGIVGESGSGKSVTSLAVMRLLDRAGRITAGRVLFKGRDITRAPAGELRSLRGAALSMIFQNPRAALNPIRSVEQQIIDVLRAHRTMTAPQARAKALDLLRAVRIRDPEQRLHAYPGELSGGMCQRVMIAMAIACEPALLIADEPTTGLDVTTQKIVMDLLAGITADRGMAMILITHDLGLAARYCQQIAVMERGLVVERGDTETLFRHARHPYTRRLIAASPTRGSTLADLAGVDDGLSADAVPSVMADPAVQTGPNAAASPVVQQRSTTGARPIVTANPGVTATPGVTASPSVIGSPSFMANPSVMAGDGRPSATLPLARSGNRPAKYPAGTGLLLELQRVVKTFTGGVKAVDDVSFSLPPGGSLGLVGESGSGKTTLSRLICRLIDADDGDVIFLGESITTTPAADFHRSPQRRDIQIVFQDPNDSLNPRFTAFDSIAHPLRRLEGLRDGAALNGRVREAAARAGLPADLLARFPHQLSGGQKARVGIARAVAPRPRLLILDEPTAALDVSIQAVILQLLDRLRRQDDIALLFVSHDLNVVRMLCEQIVVLRQGKVVEAGHAQSVFENPGDAYTRALLDAIPHFEPRGQSVAVAQ